MRANPAVVKGEPRSDVNRTAISAPAHAVTAQGAHLVADDGVGGGRTLLGAADVQDGVVEVDLFPA